MIRRARHLGAAAATSAALVAVAVLMAASAGAQGGSCTSATPCVIMVEIDGLEPKDLTPETTPFLWSLAHPTDQNLTDPNRLLHSQGRAGFTWQAARGVMTASTASASASLLTGGHPASTGVPSDEFFDNGSRRRLGAEAEEDGSFGPIDEMFADSLLTLVADQTGAKTAAFLGDPALRPLYAQDADLIWAPDPDEVQTPGNPVFCDPPRALGEDIAGEIGTPEERVGCPASDAVTMQRAFSDLSSGQGSSVTFSYVHLAELGRIKRLIADVDRPDLLEPPTPGGSELLDGGFPKSGDATVDSLALRQALLQTDVAIEEFFALYSAAAATAGKFQNTVVMVTGNHGYELTPVTHRVIVDTADLQDLPDFVADISGAKAELIPQGSMATVYYTGSLNDPAARQSTIQTVKEGIEEDVNSSDLCDSAGGCVEEVLYVDSELSPRGAAEEDTVAKKHPGWKIDHRDFRSGERTGISGDLVVVFKKGWAAGPAVPVTNVTGTVVPRTMTNPYNGSAGGPRNRAIAAIVNGPNSLVQQVPGDVAGGRHPVKTASGEPVSDDVNVVNSDPSDDADAPGHEEQAETVDFAITVAALMQLGLPEHQLEGRILQEGFRRILSLPVEEEDLGEPEPEPPPPPPPVNIIIEPRDPFDFHGLVRDLTGRVTDKDGRTRSKARPGTRLEYIQLEGDFGRPESQITLTFYREQKPKKSSTKKKKAKKRAGSKKSARAGAAGSYSPQIIIDEGDEAGEGGGEPGLGSGGEDAGRSEGRARASKTQPSKTRRRKTRRSATSACGTLVYRPLSGSRSKSRKRRGSQCRIKTLVRFAPFTIKRGHAKLTLRVPAIFKGSSRPTHVGVLVQEVKRVSTRRRARKSASRSESKSKKKSKKKKSKPKKKKKKTTPPPVAFQGVGPKGGGVVIIQGAGDLHTRIPSAKRKSTKRKSTKRKSSKRKSSKRRSGG